MISHLSSASTLKRFLVQAETVFLFSAVENKQFEITLTKMNQYESQNDHFEGFGVLLDLLAGQPSKLLPLTNFALIALYTPMINMIRD